MIPPDTTTQSSNGTLEDVAAFFRVSIRTVHEWKDAELIAHSKIGRNVWFTAQDVVEFDAQHRQPGKYFTLSPSAAKEMVKTDWLEFIGARRAGNQAQRELQKLKDRVEAHDAQLLLMSQKPLQVAA